MYYNADWMLAFSKSKFLAFWFICFYILLLFVCFFIMCFSKYIIGTYGRIHIYISIFEKLSLSRSSLKVLRYLAEACHVTIHKIVGLPQVCNNSNIIFYIFYTLLRWQRLVTIRAISISTHGLLSIFRNQQIHHVDSMIIYFPRMYVILVCWPLLLHICLPELLKLVDVS